MEGMGLGVREAGPALVCRVVELVCALPLEAVIETMRPLPIDALGAMPPFVLGVSVIRGAPVVVVDAGLLVGTRSTPARSRACRHCSTVQRGRP